MRLWREASWIQLFVIALLVGFGFWLLILLLGLLTAFTMPEAFKTGPYNLPARSPGRAIGVLVLIMSMQAAVNVAISAMGASVLWGGRFLLPKPSPAA